MKGVCKYHKLKGLFQKPGVKYPLLYVLDETGIKSAEALKVHIFRMNKEMGWQVRSKFGFIQRLV